ncbi:PDZ and LIM domain protein 7, partial [Corvus brachyrhynchos]
MESYKVMLNGPAPWGFRLQGGKDFSMPLSISRLTPGGKAAQAGVGVGDWVLYIDGESTSAMTHIEAQNRIRACGDRLCLTLSRAGSDLGAELLPSVTHRQPPQLLEPPSDTVCDPVKLRMLEDIDDSKPHTWTSQSRSFRKLARLVGANSSEFPQGLALPDCPGVPSFAGARLCVGAAGGEGVFPSFPFPFLPAVPAPQLPQTDANSPFLSWCAQWTMVRMSLLQSPGKGQQQEPQDSHGSSWGTVEQRTPGCDPGKLRMLEDAEDWQPRTGTSQSRTFRKLAQLTGTDSSMEDGEDETVKKPRVVPCFVQPGRGGAQHPIFCLYLSVTPRALVPWPLGTSSAQTPSATPGPTSRPPWAVDPSFAERYAPDKTSTVVSKHSQPATPTPMQNSSSIAQAGRTPLCYKCNKVIRGRYLVALGHYYHPEEFTCCQCRKVLDEGGFFEEKGSIFCPKCYDTRYAPSCAKCKKKITGEVMHALKMTWHVQCFTCCACKTPIRNRAFYMEEGQPYCERDYEKMFGTKCRGCDFKIDAGDRFLEALGFSWHDTCFVCAICQTNLEGKTFYSKKDKPLCKSHAFS